MEALDVYKILFFLDAYFTLLAKTSIVEYLLFDTASPSSELSITHQLRLIENALPLVFASSKQRRFRLLVCTGLLLQPALPSNHEGNQIPSQEIVDLI